MEESDHREGFYLVKGIGFRTAGEICNHTAPNVSTRHTNTKEGIGGDEAKTRKIIGQRPDHRMKLELGDMVKSHFFLFLTVCNNIDI